MTVTVPNGAPEPSAAAVAGAPGAIGRGPGVRGSVSRGPSELTASRAATSRRGIVTPEAALLELEVAGLGSRLLARVIDLLLVLALMYVLSTAASIVWIAVPQAVVVTGILTVAAALVGYPLVSEGFFGGRTLGKAALGLRVVTDQGAPASVRHSTIRALLGIVEVYATLGAVASVAVLSTRRSQRFGDLAAGTIVVRDRGAVRPARAVAFRTPYGWEAYAASLDVAAVDPHQYSLVRSFLLRVTELTPSARYGVAVRLANPLAARLRHTPPPELHPELFLACVATAYQRRYGGPTVVPDWWQTMAVAPGAVPPGQVPPPAAAPPAAAPPVAAPPVWSPPPVLAPPQVWSPPAGSASPGWGPPPAGPTAAPPPPPPPSASWQPPPSLGRGGEDTAR